MECKQEIKEESEETNSYEDTHKQYEFCPEVIFKEEEFMEEEMDKSNVDNKDAEVDVRSTFSSDNNLRNAEDTDEVKGFSAEGNFFKCLKCEYISGWKRLMALHIQTVHRKEKQFKCVLCNSSFDSKHALSKHNQMKHIEAGSYQCVECKKFYCSNTGLNCHKRRYHKKIQPLKCSECDFSTNLKCTLILHFKRNHSKFHPFQCDRCESSFDRSNRLVRHIEEVHEGSFKVKKFVCNQCGYISKVLARFSLHIQSCNKHST